MVCRATERGVRIHWGSTCFGQSPQDLYLVSIATDEQATVRDIEVIAAQTTKLLRDTPALAGEMGLVTARSAEVLTDHPLVGLWQKVAGKVPQTGKTWVALAILAAVVVSATEPGSGRAVRRHRRHADGSHQSAHPALGPARTQLEPPSDHRRPNGVWVSSSSTVDSAITSPMRSCPCPAPAPRWWCSSSRVGTTLLTNIVTNAAAAAILAPVALTVAATTRLDPILLLTQSGTCSAFTFLNPFSHQSNLMVMKPGGHSMRNFFRFGIPLTLISLMTAFSVGWALLGLR